MDEVDVLNGFFERVETDQMIILSNLHRYLQEQGFRKIRTSAEVLLVVVKTIAFKTEHLIIFGSYADDDPIIIVKKVDKVVN